MGRRELGFLDFSTWREEGVWGGCRRRISGIFGFFNMEGEGGLGRVPSLLQRKSHQCI